MVGREGLPALLRERPLINRATRAVRRPQPAGPPPCMFRRLHGRHDTPETGRPRADGGDRTSLTSLEALGTASCSACERPQLGHRQAKREWQTPRPLHRPSCLRLRCAAARLSETLELDLAVLTEHAVGLPHRSWTLLSSCAVDIGTTAYVDQGEHPSITGDYRSPPSAHDARSCGSRRHCARSAQTRLPKYRPSGTQKPRLKRQQN